MNRYYLSPAIDGRIIILAYSATEKDERIGSLAAIRGAVRLLRAKGFRRRPGMPYGTFASDRKPARPRPRSEVVWSMDHQF